MNPSLMNEVLDLRRRGNAALATGYRHHSVLCGDDEQAECIVTEHWRRFGIRRRLGRKQAEKELQLLFLVTVCQARQPTQQKERRNRFVAGIVALERIDDRRRLLRTQNAAGGPEDARKLMSIHDELIPSIFQSGPNAAAGLNRYVSERREVGSELGAFALSHSSAPPCFLATPERAKFNSLLISYRFFSCRKVTKTRAMKKNTAVSLFLYTEMARMVDAREIDKIYRTPQVSTTSSRSSVVSICSWLVVSEGLHQNPT